MHNIDYVLVGEKVKKKRLEKGYTREKLAEKCSISVSYLAHIERGTKSLSLETAFKISQILNISIDYLLIDEITEQERIMSALETELSQLNARQKDVFIKFARLIVKNIDEL